jgi:hypothetical protein
MTVEKNTFEVVTEPGCSGDFYSLWKIISNLFTFRKEPALDLDPTKNEYVIYQSDEYRIVSNHSWQHGKMFAVQDGFQLNRYFIGFTYWSEYTNCHICGMIVYFDSTGVMVEKNILESIVCKFDSRNGCIDESKAFFYKRSLLFYQVHRDIRELMLFVNLLSYSDTIHYKSTIYTQIKANQICSKKRFIHIKTDANLLIDLHSLTFVKNEKKDTLFNSNGHLLLDYYKINHESESEVDDFIKINTDEELDFEGYPLKCVNCLHLTKMGVYCCDNFTIGLGNSYCPRCVMRFSKSDNSWICCKLTSKADDDDNENYYANICSCKLNPSNNYICEQPSHSTKYGLTIRYTEQTYKYPCKDKINFGKNKL